MSVATWTIWSSPARPKPDHWRETLLTKREPGPKRKHGEAAAAALGYITSEPGRSLATRRTRRVGVVVDDLSNPFYLELLDTLHDTLARDDVRMLVFTAGRDDPERVERLMDGSIDGVVLTTTLAGSELPGDLRRRRFPVVLLNRETEGLTADTCVADNEGGAARLAEELVRLGHRRVAAILGPADTSTARGREHGLRRALSASELSLPPHRVVTASFDVDTGRRGLETLLRGGDPPTAVFCANDVIALGALNAARALGADVPGDVTIVGFDDIAVAAWELVALTTVRQDLARMAETAAAMLLARIKDPEREPQRVVLPAEVILRATHGHRRPRGPRPDGAWRLCRRGQPPGPPRHGRPPAAPERGSASIYTCLSR